MKVFALCIVFTIFFSGYSDVEPAKVASLAEAAHLCAKRKPNQAVLKPAGVVTAGVPLIVAFDNGCNVVAALFIAMDQNDDSSIPSTGTSADCDAKTGQNIMIVTCLKGEKGSVKLPTTDDAFIDALVTEASNTIYSKCGKPFDYWKPANDCVIEGAVRGKTPRSTPFIARDYITDRVKACIDMKAGKSSGSAVGSLGRAVLYMFPLAFLSFM